MMQESIQGEHPRRAIPGEQSQESIPGKQSQESNPREAIAGVGSKSDEK
jgi:hypothetical protein